MINNNKGLLTVIKTYKGQKCNVRIFYNEDILQCHTPFNHKDIQINRYLTAALCRSLSGLKMKVFLASVLLLVCANLSLQQNEAVQRYLLSTHIYNPYFCRLLRLISQPRWRT